MIFQTFDTFSRRKKVVKIGDRTRFGGGLYFQEAGNDLEAWYDEVMDGATRFIVAEIFEK